MLGLHFVSTSLSPCCRRFEVVKKKEEGERRYLRGSEEAKNDEKN